jgi:hypothetical protein
LFNRTQTLNAAVIQKHGINITALHFLSITLEEFNPLLKSRQVRNIKLACQNLIVPTCQPTTSLRRRFQTSVTNQALNFQPWPPSVE